LAISFSIKGSPICAPLAFESWGIVRIVVTVFPSAAPQKLEITVDGFTPQSRGGQGLPERRAPAGEPVAGTEAAGCVAADSV